MVDRFYLSITNSFFDGASKRFVIRRPSLVWHQDGKGKLLEVKRYVRTFRALPGIPIR